MSNVHEMVDKLYSALKICNNDKIPRNKLNKGSMDRKLNSDFSSIVGNKQTTTWSSIIK